MPEPIHPGFDWSAADAFLFDIDGTLLNTQDGVHYRAFSQAFRQVWKIEETIDGVPWHGSTDVGIIRGVAKRAGVAEEELRLPELCAVMTEELRRTRHDMRPQACSAIAEVLAYLSRSGKMLGVATGNIEAIGWAKIEACGLREYFEFGSFCGPQRETREEIFAHGVAVVRDRLGMEATVHIVGDTPADILAARRVGSPVIAVATGKYGVQDLRLHNPDLLVASLDELDLR